MLCTFIAAQSRAIVAASAVSQDVILAVLLSLMRSLMHAFTTIRSSSHSYSNYFCLNVRASSPLALIYLVTYDKY